MTFFLSLFTSIGFMAVGFGAIYVATNYMESRAEMKRLLTECRDALRRLENKH